MNALKTLVNASAHINTDTSIPWFPSHQGSKFDQFRFHWNCEFQPLSSGLANTKWIHERGEAKPAQPNVLDSSQFASVTGLWLFCTSTLQESWVAKMSLLMDCTTAADLHVHKECNATALVASVLTSETAYDSKLIAHTSYRPCCGMWRIKKERACFTSSQRRVNRQTEKHQKLNIRLTKVKVEGVRAFQSKCDTVDLLCMLWTNHKSFQQYAMVCFRASYWMCKEISGKLAWTNGQAQFVISRENGGSIKPDQLANVTNKSDINNCNALCALCKSQSAPAFESMLPWWATHLHQGFLLTMEHMTISTITDAAVLIALHGKEGKSALNCVFCMWRN